MSTLRPILIALVVFVCCFGCGGGGGGGNPNPPPPPGNQTTRVILNINWPERSRSLDALSSSLSAVVLLKGANENGSDFTWTLNRDPGTAAASKRYVSPTLVKTGTWELTIRLYSQPDGGGTLVGTAGAVVNLKVDGELGNLTVIGVISSIQVGAGQGIAVGQKKDLAFTALDSSGNMIPVTPGSATWQVVTGADKLRFVNGQAEGLAAGVTSVRATVDGKTGPPTDVNVGTGTLQVNVKDPFGALIPGVTITLFQGGVQVQQVNSPTGAQTIPNVVVGQVEVRAAKNGFKPNQTTVTVNLNTTTTADVTLTAEGLPSVSTSAARIISTSGATMVFEVDVRILDGDGNPMMGLPASAFTFDPFTLEGVTYTFTQASVTPFSKPYEGPFSAFLAVDQSGSILQTDPNNSRLQAAKVFLSALANGDNAMFGYFPDANDSPHLKTFPEIGFVTDGSAYYPKIDALMGQTFQSTPLFAATVEAIGHTITLGPLPNRAVVVFTDGQPANDRKTLEETVAEALARNVKIHTVGLGLATNTALLAELAIRTGGSTMYATDAGQLVSFYKSLGALLQGSGDFYRTRWTVTRSPGVFVMGDKLSATMKIAVPGRTLLAPFFVLVR